MKTYKYTIVIPRTRGYEEKQTNSIEEVKKALRMRRLVRLNENEEEVVGISENGEVETL